MTHEGYVLLYKAIVKSIKTAQCYIDWAEKAKENDEKELAIFLGKRAQQELEKDMAETHNMFTAAAKGEEGFNTDNVQTCLFKETHETMVKWVDNIKKRIAAL